ncbi:hypothetical protein AKG95_18000 [Janthinobacterium lividum]|uniref:Uncharacterized protein n=1 Tax=Janthinobacterium lividum TaxID=29581 RepID=A0A1S1U8H8_9BURK|nr:hypothetical protein [Janthinobacterium lividum]OHV96606.1 hypothetical protein AKG95_18000 [Janthinobacterium lividum]
MEELFKNTHDALMFAYNYSSQQYALSPMSKLMKGGGGGSGKGLVSLDGAGQSGIILTRLAQMTPLERACITARYAPRYEECPCCLNKDKMTEQYREAIAELAEWALSVCTGLTIRNMRGAIIRSFFERGVSITAAAKELNVAKATAYDQKARIHKALKDLDGRAQRAADAQLAGMCGDLVQEACAGQTCPV